MSLPSLLNAHVVGIVFLPWLVFGLTKYLCFTSPTIHSLSVLKNTQKLICNLINTVSRQLSQGVNSLFMGIFKYFDIISHYPGHLQTENHYAENVWGGK